ncbi:hypothetical protein CE91St62_35960 [Lachnospiraceae bacterium]|nr:hypothetical protein CE91St61_36080 [Lachnospiraceae bacterium]BDF39535.1 hypothetical protein CE91St62_35960 [Lachnospiraceae bacterium]
MQDALPVLQYISYIAHNDFLLQNIYLLYVFSTNGKENKFHIQVQNIAFEL